jgi:DNA-binding transcriptional regulator YhcF (GntR family)
MRQDLDISRPLFLQVKEAIEEDILSGALQPGEQIPSNAQLVAFFGINPVTVHKGVSLLVDDGIVFKKRGLGMFVEAAAPAKLRERRQASFGADHVQPLVSQAQGLGMSLQEVCALIRDSWQGGEQ